MISSVLATATNHASPSRGGTGFAPYAGSLSGSLDPGSSSGPESAGRGRGSGGKVG